MEKLELAGKFRRRFKSHVHPDLNSLRICKDNNVVFLEFIFAHTPSETKILYTNFISNDIDVTDLYFDPNLDIIDLAERFLKFDDYSFVNCFSELFSTPGAYKIARKWESENRR